jgi:hypothetical protein
MRKCIVEAVVVGLIIIFLLLVGVKAAYIERGYEAVGGEYGVLLLPVLYYGVKRSIKDTVAVVRENDNTDQERGYKNHEQGITDTY